MNYFFGKNISNTTVVASVFLSLQLLLVFANWGSEVDGLYLWYCNNVLFLFALAFYFRWYQFIKGLINVGFLGQLVWLVDVASFFFFGEFLFGFSEYLFDMENAFLVATTFIIHICSSFLALFFVYDKKTRVSSLYVSAAYVLALYGLVLLFTDPASNVNCVYAVCGLEDELTIPFHVFLWPFAVFTLFILPVFGLQYLLSLRFSDE